jgi:amino acid transporter
MGSSGGRKRASRGHTSSSGKASSGGGGGSSGGSSAASSAHEQTLDIDPEGNKSGLWGALAGVIVAAIIAVPLSAAFAFATNPHTQQLFAGRLEEATQGGYQTFWWIVTLLLLSLPFLVGFGVAKLSAKSLVIVGAIVALFIIAIMVMGQLFIF